MADADPHMVVYEHGDVTIGHVFLTREKAEAYAKRHGLTDIRSARPPAGEGQATAEIWVDEAYKLPPPPPRWKVFLARLFGRKVETGVSWPDETVMTSYIWRERMYVTNLTTKSGRRHAR